MAVQVIGCTQKSNVPFKRRYLEMEAVAINTAAAVQFLCNRFKSRITEVEVTEAQKPYQGTNPGKGCNLSRAAFLLTFFPQKK